MDKAAFQEEFFRSGQAAARRLKSRPDYIQSVEALATAIMEMLERHGGPPLNVILWMFRGELPIPDLEHADDWEWCGAVIAEVHRRYAGPPERRSFCRSPGRGALPCNYAGPGR